MHNILYALVWFPTLASWPFSGSDPVWTIVEVTPVPTCISRSIIVCTLAGTTHQRNDSKDGCMLKRHTFMSSIIMTSCMHAQSVHTYIIIWSTGEFMLEML